MRPLVLCFLLTACGAPAGPPSAACVPPEKPGDTMNCGCRGVVCPARIAYGTKALICCSGLCGHPLADAWACGHDCKDCRPEGKVCDRGACVRPEDACPTPALDDGTCPPGLRWDLGCCR